MFNIKLDEKSYKMSFKVLPVKIQREKTGAGHNAPPPPSPREIGLMQGSFISE